LLKSSFNFLAPSSTLEAPFAAASFHIFSYFISSFFIVLPCFIKILFVLSAVASILSFAFWQHYQFYVRQHQFCLSIFFTSLTFAESTPIPFSVTVVVVVVRSIRIFNLFCF
jgi:hypothetical protein